MLLGCLAAYLLAGLFGRGLWKADEPYSFGMVWNFLTTPDWLIPRVGTAPFMEKPPLMYWTGALAARLSAPWLSAPDGARLAVLGWMLVTLAALAWLTERLLPGRRREAVLALLGMLGVVQHRHLLIADVPQLAGATLGLAGLAAHLHDHRHPWRHGLLFGSGLGIAFMSKGLLVPGVLGLTGLLCALCWPRRLVEPEGRLWLLAASLAALPWLLVWPVLLWHRAPELFHTWLWTNNIGRFFGLEARNSDTDGLASSLADLLALSFPTGLILLSATLWQLYRRGGSPLKRCSAASICCRCFRLWRCWRRGYSHRPRSPPSGAPSVWPSGRQSSPCWRWAVSAWRWAGRCPGQRWYGTTCRSLNGCR